MPVESKSLTPQKWKSLTRNDSILRRLKSFRLILFYISSRLTGYPPEGRTRADFSPATSPLAPRAHSSEILRNFPAGEALKKEMRFCTLFRGNLLPFQALLTETQTQN